MLLGITLSNLSEGQKNLKAEFFLTKFAKCLGTSTQQKKLCREPRQRTRQHFYFAECQLETLGNISPLPSASWRHSAKS
jgi:hypothetical protein